MLPHTAFPSHSTTDSSKTCRAAGGSRAHHGDSGAWDAPHAQPRAAAASTSGMIAQLVGCNQEEGGAEQSRERSVGVCLHWSHQYASAGTHCCCSCSATEPLAALRLTGFHQRGQGVAGGPPIRVAVHLAVQHPAAQPAAHNSGGSGKGGVVVAKRTNKVWAPRRVHPPN